MAEVYDRLGRFDRREELARRVAQPALPEVAPAAEQDGFAEVLEAVGRVVRRRPGVSVMVAREDRPGPVVRIGERDGEVDAIVVGHRGAPAPPAPPRLGTGRMAEALGGAARAAERPEPAADRPEPEVPARFGRMAQALGGAARADRPEPAGPVGPVGRHAQPEQEPPAPSGRVPLPPETSEVVSRLAQLLRADPSIAASWGREQD